MLLRSLDLVFVFFTEFFKEPTGESRAARGGEDAAAFALWLYKKSVSRS